MEAFIGYIIRPGKNDFILHSFAKQMSFEITLIKGK